MEQIASKIVFNMMQANIIEENESEEYIYGIQILLEKVISYSIIILIALVLHRLFEIVLFLSAFSFLRKYSGGIHCKRFTTCLMASTIVTFSSVAVFPLVENNILLYQGGAYNVNNNCRFDWCYKQPQYQLEREGVQANKA